MRKKVEPKGSVNDTEHKSIRNNFFFTLSLTLSYFPSSTNMSTKDSPFLPHLHCSRKIIQLLKHGLA